MVWSDEIKYAGLSFLADAAIVALLYKCYKGAHSYVSEVEESKNISMSDNLEKEVLSGNITGYVCVEGLVNPIGEALQSSFNSEKQGVVKRNILVEEKSARIQGTSSWSDVKNIIKDVINYVPFTLGTKSTDTKIHIESPRDARFLQDGLTTTYDHFEPDKSNFVQKAFNALYGENHRGLHETEEMLLVGTSLLGIGDLVYEDKKLRLVPPSDVRRYILTTLSKRELINELKSNSKFFKVLLVIFGGIGGCVLLYLLIKMKEEWDRRRLQKKFLAELRSRQNGGAADNDSLTDDSSCVICLTAERNIALLNCGHVCLCSSCFDVLPLPKLCPVCRQSIVRQVPLYMS